MNTNAAQEELSRDAAPPRPATEAKIYPFPSARAASVDVTDMRASAKILGSLGIPVFRLTVNGKDPLEKGWADGVGGPKATTNLDEIHRLWTAVDGSPARWNIGLLMGEGWVALDYDCKPKFRKDRVTSQRVPILDDKGRQLVGTGLDVLYEHDALHDLPHGYRQETGSGGMHVILRLPEGRAVRSSVGKLHRDVDVRGHRGFVVGAGSVVDGKPYLWYGGELATMPDDFVDWCGAPIDRAADASIPLVDWDKPENVERARRYLIEVAPEAVENDGGDDTTYRVACAVRDYAISELLCFDLMSEHWNEAGKAIPSWDADGLERKIANAYQFAKSRPGTADPAVEFEPSVDLDEGEAERPKAPMGETSWPTPFEPFDPVTLPRREWLYGKHLIRRYVSAAVSPGGVGKTALKLAEAIALATGRDVLGIAPVKRCRVWFWNGEDPIDEVKLRVAALCQLHDIPMETLRGWLFLDSGRDMAIILAHIVQGQLVLAEGMLDQLEVRLKAAGIDVMIGDPWVSMHRVPENDNGAVDAVVKALGRIAERARIAIELVHHSAKMRGEEVTADSARGASALVDGVRSAQVLNRMSQDEAGKLGISEEARRSYFRVDGAKENMGPPQTARWYRHVNVVLPNGEHVGAVQSWVPPTPSSGITSDHIRQVQEKLAAAGPCREHDQSPEWVGHLIGEVLDLDTEQPHHKKRIKRLQAEWTASGHLKVVERLNKKRESKRFVEVGECVA